MIHREFEPGTFERGQEVPNVVWNDMLQRSIEFEAGPLEASIDDYAEKYLMPHAIGLAALLRMAHAWQVFDLPLPKGMTCCRHVFDGISMRMLVLPGDIFRFDVLFRPRPYEAKPLVKFARVA